MAEASRLGDVDLLRLQAVDLAPARGSTRGLRGVVVVQTAGAVELWVGSEAPPALAAALRAAHSAVGWSAGGPVQVGEPPRSVDACAALLTAHGWDVECDAGPVYVIPPSVRFGSSARIVRSDALRAGPAPRAANPGNWHPLEWEELLSGVLGPWAMAVAGGQVVSICHTPRAMTARAAECGVWTDPGWRGRGLAAAVTSVWAEVVRPSGRVLFYSTDAANVSSQRVAARLGLRLLGWLWRVAEAREEEDGGLHPLSRARR